MSVADVGTLVTVKQYNMIHGHICLHQSCRQLSISKNKVDKMWNSKEFKHLENKPLFYHSTLQCHSFYLTLFKDIIEQTKLNSKLKVDILFPIKK